MTDTTDTSSPAARDGGRLADNIVHFARALRAAGLPVGPAAVVDAVNAVEAAGIASREDFYWTLHAIFVKKRDQRPVFDEAFRIFWRSRGLVEKMLELLSPVAPPRAAPEKPKAAQARVAEALQQQRKREAEETKPEIEIDASFTVSGAEVLQTKDFAQMSAAEIAQAKAALKRLILPVDTIRQRRLVASAARRRVDPRRSLRASLRAGGDIIALKYRKPAEIHPPIVALCDISGSMSQYTRIFLHFMHVITERRRGVHTFLFGTRLTNITRQMRYRDPDEAVDQCVGMVKDWSGGTRIGETLHEFNRNWSRRVLGQGATVILITDGLERDSIDELDREMDRLHRSCRRLVWLNPLLRFDGFEARARGVRTILRHVDEVRAVHNIAAMSDLVTALGDDRHGKWDPRRLAVPGQ